MVPADGRAEIYREYGNLRANARWKYLEIHDHGVRGTPGSITWHEFINNKPLDLRQKQVPFTCDGRISEKPPILLDRMVALVSSS